MLKLRSIFKLAIVSPLIGVSSIFIGCVSPARIDYDKEAITTIQSYKCFVLDSRETRTNYQDIVLSPIVDKRIERAINQSLLERGFSNQCASPDFHVTFNTATKTKTEFNDIRVGSPRYKRYPYCEYNRYSYVQVDEYEEGTFIIDIIDEKSKEIVWRGAYAQRLGWSAPSDEEVKKIIDSILEEFPPEISPEP